MNQRWLFGRPSYRPKGETIRTLDYEVVPLADDARPRAFVEAHHYSGSFPAARFRFGLYRADVLEGVAVFSVPPNDKTLTNEFPVPAIEAVELGRFVLLDSVAGNGESWFLGRCFEQLRAEGLFGVVSFSDPVERTNAAGVRVFPGHVGTIYQAFNGRYVGRGTARTIALMPDGSVFAERTLQKLRKRERGWQGAVEQLRAFGAPAPRGDLGEWAKLWVRRLSRPLRHPGNHKYVWALAKRDRRHLRPALPFPKLGGC